MEPKFVKPGSSNKKQSKKEAQKQKIQAVILGLLLLVFVFMMITTFFGGKGKKKKTVVVPPKITAATSVSPGSPKQQAASLEFKNDPAKYIDEADEWGKSPFSMGAIEEEEEAAKKVKLILQGAVYSEDETSSIAIINEKIVKKGDQIADNTVKEIAQGKVVLEDSEGNEFVLLE